MKHAVFEIEGAPRRKMVRELRSYIAVSSTRIHVEVDGEADDIDIMDVFNIFIQEPWYFDIKSRTTVIDYYFEGDEMRYELDDDIYPGLSARMEGMLEEYWPHFAEKKKYPGTIMWFNAACAALCIVDNLDPGIFGGMFDTMEASVSQKEALHALWGIEKRDDLRAALERLLKGGSVWARVSAIRLAATGFICGYLNLRGALGYCLLAGQSLQVTCRGWDGMMHEYLKEYCKLEKQDLEDENSRACDICETHDSLMRAAKGPYDVDFYYRLSEEW